MAAAEPAQASTRRAPDWARAVRVVFEVRQRYSYNYSAPVTDVRQRLVMVPPTRHGGQRLLEHDLAVRGDVPQGTFETCWESDRFGNRVCLASVPRVVSRVDFEATYRVERRRSAGPVPAGITPAVAHGELLQETALTAPDRRLRAVAAGIAGGSREPRGLAERAAEWAAGAISYRVGVTGVQTPAAMALHLGQGVCQDYAHLLLCVLRLLGVPARYVSGHLPGDGVPHAWVEALLESPADPGGLEAVAYDPTHRRRAGLQYITVAVGRDFADVTPTSGTYSGPATGRLSAEKRTDLVEHSGQPNGEAAA